MEKHPAVDYKGFTILPKPTRGNDGKWYGGYDIQKDALPVSTRTYIFPGFLFESPAAEDSIEHAKTEVDNLIVSGHGGR